MKLSVCLASCFAVFACSYAVAGTFVSKSHLGERAITNSYLVKFKDDLSESERVVRAPSTSLKKERRLEPNAMANDIFGAERSQLKEAATNKLAIPGKVSNVYENLNIIHVSLDESAARKLAQDNRVEWVQQETTSTRFATQNNVAWALGRMDKTIPTASTTYTYTNSGAGQNIVIVDTGLAWNRDDVKAEFGTRAHLLADFNAGGTGNDCTLTAHGTGVASLAGGTNYGTAKGATLFIVKESSGCDNLGPESNTIAAFNWLAGNAPVGTIVNWSGGYGSGETCIPETVPAVEAAVKAMFNAGLIVVVAAGNDGCNAEYFTPTNLAEAFSVGMVQEAGHNATPAKDWAAAKSRYGSTIAGYAPGVNVEGLGPFGTASLNGTSFAAPMVAGIFASACQAISSLPTNCNSSPNTAAIYNAMKNAQPYGTVTANNGLPLPAGTPSRFIGQRW